MKFSWCKLSEESDFGSDSLFTNSGLGIISVAGGMQEWRLKDLYCVMVFREANKEMIGKAK